MNETNLLPLVQQLRQGDPHAREELVALMYERLVKLARRMMRTSSRSVQRWAQTDDLVHNAWIRIQRVLEEETLELEDDAHLFRICGRHMRFELIDLYRKLTGAHGIAANHQTMSPQKAGDAQAIDGERFQANSTLDPRRLANWAEFHQIVEALPDDQRIVADLLWYQGLKQQEAADLLHVDVKTVKRRWRSAKLALAEQLDSNLIRP